MSLCTSRCERRLPTCECMWITAAQVTKWTWWSLIIHVIESCNNLRFIQLMKFVRAQYSSSHRKMTILIRFESNHLLMSTVFDLTSFDDRCCFTQLPFHHFKAQIENDARKIRSSQNMRKIGTVFFFAVCMTLSIDHVWWQKTVWQLGGRHQTKRY